MDGWSLLGREKEKKAPQIILVHCESNWNCGGIFDNFDLKRLYILFMEVTSWQWSEIWIRFSIRLLYFRILSWVCNHDEISLGHGVTWKVDMLVHWQQLSYYFFLLWNVSVICIFISSFFCTVNCSLCYCIFDLFNFLFHGDSECREQVDITLTDMISCPLWRGNVPTVKTIFTFLKVIPHQVIQFSRLLEVKHHYPRIFSSTATTSYGTCTV